MKFPFFLRKINKDQLSDFIKGDDVEISSSKINLINSKLIVHKGVKIFGVNFYLKNASIEIGANTHFGFCDKTINVQIESGTLIIGNNNVLKCDFVIRFSGKCLIGNFNAINPNTEIRCDEFIQVGDFNMISYNCQINDTNTHTLLEPNIRRKITINDFPFIGAEYEKPPTSPILIKNDCWIGKDVTILKGVTIEDQCVIGTKAVVTKSMPKRHLAIGNPARIILNEQA